MTSVVLCGFSLVWGVQHSGLPLHLHASVVAGVEGGPVVVKADYINSGDTPLAVSLPLQNPSLATGATLPLDAAQGVAKQPASRSFTIWLQPKECYSRFLFLHHDRIIPAGAYAVTLRCSTWVQPAYLGHEEKGSQAVANTVETTLDINVAPADPEQLAKCVKTLQRCLHTSGYKEADVECVTQMVLGTKHKAFYPVALELLEHGNHLLDARLTNFMENLFGGMEKATDCWLAYVERSDPKAIPAIFHHWHSNSAQLNSKQMQRLRNVENIWVRVLTYVSFSNVFSEPDATALMEQLVALPPPIPFREFTQLVANLDHKAFHERDQATKRLEQLGIDCEPALRRCLEKCSSAEARVRIEFILRGFQVRDFQSATPGRVIRSLRHWDSKESRKVLKHLGKGPASSFVTQEAQHIIEEGFQVRPVQNSEFQQRLEKQWRLLEERKESNR